MEAEEVMRTATRQSRILGPNGKPVSLGQLYRTPRYSPKAYKPRPWLSNDTRQNVCSYDRMELVNYSRQLVSQIGILATAISQKNNWAFGDAWDPHYIGRDRYAWVEEAKEFLEQQFYPFCNVRGPQFNLRESLKLMGKAWDRDGDDLMLLTETEGGFPQIAFYPATRIGTYGDKVKRSLRSDDVITEGQFTGAKIFDGYILDRNNRTIGVRVLNDDGTHTDYSTFNADPGFEPQWSDQVRGIPPIAVSLLTWLHLQETDDFIHDSVKRASKVGFKVKNAEGEAATGNEINTEGDSPAASDTNSVIVDGSDDRKLYYEEVAGGGGELWYLDATQNEDIEQLDYSNPHPNIEEFIKRRKHDAIGSIGWHHELLYLGDSGRAATRALADLANNTIWARQETATRRWKRIIGYALAKGANNGYIRKPRDPRDYGRWAPGYPKLISVDAGNDVKSAIEMTKFGISTASIEAAKLGYHIDFIREQQERELSDVFSMAFRLWTPEKKAAGVQLMDLVQMIRQNNPNPVSQPQQQEAKNAD